jgi:hypothetical protein
MLLEVVPTYVSPNDGSTEGAPWYFKLQGPKLTYFPV